MNDNQAKESSLVDTTDCLEAVGVFRGWKNFLFIVTFVCLLLLQASFWAVQTGYVKAEKKTETGETTLPVIKLPPAIKLPPLTTPPSAKELVVPLEDKQTSQPARRPNKIEKAVKQVATEPNQPAARMAGQPEAAPQQQKSPLFEMTFERLAWLIRFVDFVLIPTAILYCLTMLFSLKVSLLGRLGGINHIARAFFLSLAFVVLLMPWQRFFAGVVVGAMYTPGELQNACAEAEGYNIFATTLHYLRFTGYWLLVLLLLIFSQIRSGRWAKAILRRLEVI